jgi:hypothetical protein
MSLADRAEMSLLKLWLRSKLRVPTRLDVGAHRLAKSGVTFEPLPAHVVREPLLAVFARVKTAMHRMGIFLSQTDGVELVADSDVCFLEDLVHLLEARRQAMATSGSEGLVSVAAIGQWPHDSSSRRLLSVKAVGQPWGTLGVVSKSS